MVLIEVVNLREANNRISSMLIDGSVFICIDKEEIEKHMVGFYKSLCPDF